MIEIKMLAQYKAWANEVIFSAVKQLPESEAVKTRQTRFGSIAHTVNHVYVIDDVFKAHLLGSPHKYTSRNTDTHPSVKALTEQQKEIDDWYIDYTKNTSESELAKKVQFEFSGGIFKPAPEIQH